MSNYEPLFERPTANHHPREVLKHGITGAILDGETALFDVLPGIGKSRSIPKVAKTGIPITVLTNLTENYEQYERWGEEEGIEVQKLPVARNLCPTLQGEFPEDGAANDAMEADAKEWTPAQIHREFDVPCERGDRTCPYREATAELDPDSSGLLVGHFTQAYNPAYIENRAVVIDERCFEAYRDQIRNPIEKAEQFINTLEDFPFKSVRRPEPGEEQNQTAALSQLEDAGLDPTDHRDEVGEFHAKAPLTAYAIYGAERLENGLCVADLPGNRTAVFESPHGYGDDDENRGSVWIFDPPDLSKAEATIGLDATPCLSNWRRVLGDGFEHYRLLSDRQRNQYLHEQGYEFIQLNGYVWPVSNANVSVRKCEAYLREIQRVEERPPDLITSKQMLEKLEDEGLAHLWNDDLYYGDLRGKNDLADSELLVVLGSRSRPDYDIQWKAALHGEYAEPATDSDGERLSGHQLDFQNDVANDILETIRCGETFQAAMRAGRTGDTEASVYVATGMVPEWLDTKKVGRRKRRGTVDACRKTRDDSDRAVLTVLLDEDGISGREIARRADLPKSTALDALDRLRDEGLVELQGRGRGARWHANGVDDVNIAGCVELERMADLPYNYSIRKSRPFSGRVTPRWDPPVDPTLRYPDWMRDIQRRVRGRRLNEQLRQVQRNLA